MTVGTDHPYQRIAEELRGKILKKELGPGESLPSEAALQAQYRVARGTVRRAISELVSVGLVVSRPGYGHLVRTSVPLVWVASRPERNTDTTLSPADVWSRSVREQGRMPSEYIRVERALADEYIGSWLNLAPGDQVVIRRRLRHVDGEAYQTADSYYPLNIVRGTAIENPGDVLPGVWQIYEQLGREWMETQDRIIPRAPSREEAQQLHIPRGVQVAEVVRRSFDRNNIPVRLTIFILPQDRHEIEYHMSEGARS